MRNIFRIIFYFMDQLSILKLSIMNEIKIVIDIVFATTKISATNFGMKFCGYLVSRI